MVITLALHAIGRGCRNMRPRFRTPPRVNSSPLFFFSQVIFVILITSNTLIQGFFGNMLMGLLPNDPAHVIMYDIFKSILKN